MMDRCKRCDSGLVVKHGFVRGKQRYACQACGYRFVHGDERVDESLVVKKALAVILYSLGKASFGMLGQVFGVSRSLTYHWIKEEAERLPEPVVPCGIKEMEFGEMWHFLGSKKTSGGSSRPWIVAHGELWPGLSAIVMLQPSSASTRKSNT
jgi:transposase